MANDEIYDARRGQVHAEWEREGRTFITGDHILVDGFVAECPGWRSGQLIDNKSASIPRRTKLALTFDLLSVRCTSIVCVYLLCCGILIECHETVQQIVACSVVVITAGIVWEIITQWRERKLLSEQVDLIQEQNLYEGT